MKKEWERRETDNAISVRRLRQNLTLWEHAGGADPEKLLRPSEADLAAAHEAAWRKQHGASEHAGAPSSGIYFPAGHRAGPVAPVPSA